MMDCAYSRLAPAFPREVRRQSLVLDISAAHGAMTGSRYLESLNDGREVWLDGQRVQDVTKHPAFTGVVHELARIYDLQHSDDYRDRMTFVSPKRGTAAACRGCSHAPSTT